MPAAQTPSDTGMSQPLLVMCGLPPGSPSLRNEVCSFANQSEYLKTVQWVHLYTWLWTLLLALERGRVGM